MSTSAMLPATASGSLPSFVSPREKMRLAKLALMEDEQREESLRKERRLSRRASSTEQQGESGFGVQAEAKVETDPYTRLPSYGILRRSSLSPLKMTSYPSAPSSSLSPVERPSQPRRRSSRVRFSEDPLPSANSSPGSTHLVMREDSALPIHEEPSINVHPPEMSRSSHEQVTREDQVGMLDRVEMLAPPSPVLSRRGSIASISSAASDPFGLQGALGSPVASTISRLNSDAFAPQPLPYTQLDKVLAKLNREDSLILSNGSESPSRTSLSTSETLRQAIERPSLLVPPSARASASHRSSSTSGTLSSTASRATSTTSQVTPSSLRSSAIGTSFASTAGTLSSLRTDSVLSATASSLSLDSANLPARLSHRGAAYASLLPTSRAFECTPVLVPTLNRQQWHDVDIGLSPRSGPTPIAPETSWVPIAPMPDFGPRPEHFEAIPLSASLGLRLPPLSPVRRAFDSIDLLPQPSRSNSVQASLTQLTSVKSGERGHQRTESDFSLDLAFPLPPDRLDVKLVTPVIRRKKASLSLAPRVDPGMALLVECQPSIDESDTERPVLPVALETPARNRKSLVIDTLQCADACSLTAAVLQVGTPTSEASSLRKGHSPSSSIEFTPRPASPGLSDMIEQTLRARKSTVGFNMDEEESDLDTAAPLVQVALKSRILSPNSRLLRSRDKPRTLRRVSTTSTLDLKSGVSLTKGLGWSGSESEEEEWARTVRSIAQRKASRSSIGSTRSTPARQPPSVRTRERTESSEKSGSAENRYSQASTTSSVFSEVSITSTMTTHLLTPSASLDIPTAMNRTISSGSISSERSGSITPGKYPWGKSSPIRSSFPDLPPVNNVYVALLSSSSTTSKIPTAPRRPKQISPEATRMKAKRVMSMPLPKRVEDWGEPEILIDGEDTDYWNGDIGLAEVKVPIARYSANHGAREKPCVVAAAAAAQRFGLSPKGSSTRIKRVSSSVVPRAGSPDFSVLGLRWGESLLAEEVEV